MNKVIYSQKETNLIKKELKRILPLANIKQFIDCSGQFIALFEVDDSKVAIVKINVSLTWEDEKAGMFQLDINSTYNIEEISEVMHRTIELEISMN